MTRAFVLALSVALVGCAALQPALNAVDGAGRALAPVLGWCRDAGADAATVQRAVEAAQAKDYRTAVVLADEMLRNMREAGRDVPREHADMVALAMGALAAQAIDEGMSAVSR